MRSILVALIAVAVYIGAPGNGFVFDDREIVLSNKLVQEPGHVGEILTSHYWHPIRQRGYLYRPLTILSFRVDQVLGGGKPFPFHATNVLLHAAVSLAVLMALTLAYGAGMVPLVGAILFAVHPIHSEAVAGIAGRADLLAALFAILAWAMHMKRRHVASALLFLAALLSKESAIVLPGILLAADWSLARPKKGYGPVMIAAVVYFGLRFAILSSPVGGDPSLIHPLDNPLAAAPVIERVMTAIGVMAIQAWLLVFPLNLSADYSFNQIPLVKGPGDPLFLAGAFLVIAAAACAWLFRERRAGPTLPILLHLVCIAPIANILVPIGTVLAERTLYLPSIGFCAGAALVLARLRIPAILVILLMGWRTVTRVPDWNTDLSLFSRAVEVCPRSAKAQYNTGIEHLKAGRAADALPFLEAAVEISRGLPGRVDMMRDFATALARVGREDEALALLEKARAIDPAHVGILVNIGNIYATRGEFARALAAYDAALAVDPGHTGARGNRAQLLRRMGR